MQLCLLAFYVTEAELNCTIRVNLVVRTKRVPNHHLLLAVKNRSMIDVTAGHRKFTG